MTWNSLPDNLRDPTLTNDKFKLALKHTYSPSIRTCGALEASLRNCAFISALLLTYLLCSVLRLYRDEALQQFHTRTHNGQLGISRFGVEICVFSSTFVQLKQ